LGLERFVFNAKAAKFIHRKERKVIALWSGAAPSSVAEESLRDTYEVDPEGGLKPTLHILMA